MDARGLRSSDASRLGDVVVLDFFRYGQHILIDAVVTTVYRNTVLHQVSTVPGFVAKQVEDRKFYADKSSTDHVASIYGGPHFLCHLRLKMAAVLVPTPRPFFVPLQPLPLRKDVALLCLIETPPPPLPLLSPCGPRDGSSAYLPGCTVPFQSKSCASCALMPLLANPTSRASRCALAL